MTRRIIVYIATSADGYIARSDGSVDWLDRPRTVGDYGMAEFHRSIDTVIWGRRTFDEGIVRIGGLKAFTKSMSGFKNYVISHREGPSAPGLEFVSGSIKELAKKLRAEPGKNIWIMGGGGVIGSFLDAGEIDEFMIHVIPKFIGEGIPLIQPGRRDVPLQLVNHQTWADGVVKLTYEVKRARVNSRKSKRER